ncbi:hypothetical protein EVAR_95467_1 [Eumeta japonica]|uniref:Uncharacterized protein n=1 Tax=Eumeta variegata TaxID=151549 RepID=A0A4C1UIQ1_EUMVA|nr:hypothetical protein EVAR_95467_1 [Eumeta japonica]
MAWWSDGIAPKTALTRLNQSWIEKLPIILLGLRAVPRSDTNVSAAESTFGKTLRLPGDFYDTDRNVSYDSYEYVQNLRQSIDRLKPRPAARNSKHIFVYPKLKTCDKVFVRNDTVRKTLQPPYDRPYNVIKRSNKIFTLQLPDRKAKFPIDRLKPAYVLNETDVTDETSPQKSSGCTAYADDASAIARRAQAAHGTFSERGPGTNSLPYMILEICKIFLVTQGYAFHTYSLIEEREIRVVLRGVSRETPIDEIKEDLRSQNLPMQSVHRILNRFCEPFDLVLVSGTAEANDKATKANTPHS